MQFCNLVRPRLLVHRNNIIELEIFYCYIIFKIPTWIPHIDNRYYLFFSFVYILILYNM